MPSHSQANLFGDELPSALPLGMRYEANFVNADEERQLLEHIGDLPLEQAQYKQYLARRRVLSFGGHYDFDANRLLPSSPLALCLEPLRQHVAEWLGVEPNALVHCLVAEYQPGTPLGWHRDVPNFESIVGVSLGSACLLKLRPYPPQPSKRADVLTIDIEPRSIYTLQGPVRWEWQHSVPPVKALRYSITFRTARR